MPKKTALQKIEYHEKLCRIMQKQTFERIDRMEASGMHLIITQNIIERPMKLGHAFTRSENIMFHQ